MKGTVLQDRIAERGYGEAGIALQQRLRLSVRAGLVECQNLLLDGDELLQSVGDRSGIVSFLAGIDAGVVVRLPGSRHLLAGSVASFHGSVLVNVHGVEVPVHIRQLRPADIDGHRVKLSEANHVAADFIGCRVKGAYLLQGEAGYRRRTEHHHGEGEQEFGADADAVQAECHDACSEKIAMPRGAALDAGLTEMCERRVEARRRADSIATSR